MHVSVGGFSSPWERRSDDSSALLCLLFPFSSSIFLSSPYLSSHSYPPAACYPLCARNRIRPYCHEQELADVHIIINLHNYFCTPTSPCPTVGWPSRYFFQGPSCKGQEPFCSSTRLLCLLTPGCEKEGQWEPPGCLDSTHFHGRESWFFPLLMSLSHLLAILGVFQPVFSLPSIRSGSTAVIWPKPHPWSLSVCVLRVRVCLSGHGVAELSGWLFSPERRGGGGGGGGGKGGGSWPPSPPYQDD